MISVQSSRKVKEFLEFAQPLPVLYAHAQNTPKVEEWIVYQSMGAPEINMGIGNFFISERIMFLITIKTKTALRNMLVTDLIKVSTQGTDLRFISDNPRKGQQGFLNGVIISVFNSLADTAREYTEQNVREWLQKIADNYIFVTSRYGWTIGKSFIDALTIPKQKKDAYTYNELLKLKQKHLDKLLLNATEY